MQFQSHYNRFLLSLEGTKNIYVSFCKNIISFCALRTFRFADYKSYEKNLRKTSFFLKKAFPQPLKTHCSKNKFEYRKISKVSEYGTFSVTYNSSYIETLEPSETQTSFQLPF